MFVSCSPLQQQYCDFFYSSQADREFKCFSRCSTENVKCLCIPTAVTNASFFIIFKHHKRVDQSQHALGNRSSVHYSDDAYSQTTEFTRAIRGLVHLTFLSTAGGKLSRRSEATEPCDSFPLFCLQNVTKP